MLRRAQRVTKDLFDEAIQKGRVLHSPLFVVRVLHQAGLGSSRIAAVAPVKVAKTSVLRHRIRRRIYEAVRPDMTSLTKDHVVIIMAKQTVIAAEFADLKRAVHDIFVKAGLLR